MLAALAQKAASSVRFSLLRLGGKGRRPKVVKGIIATGDVFVASESKKAFLAKAFRADAVEMEGAAVAQVCYQQAVPFVVLRSLSDNADHRAEDDLEKFYKTAAKNSAALTLALLRGLAR
jgi:adenosylhomocysteine nucleosidase